MGSRRAFASRAELLTQNHSRSQRGSGSRDSRPRTTRRMERMALWADMGCWELLGTRLRRTSAEKSYPAVSTMVKQTTADMMGTVPTRCFASCRTAVRALTAEVRVATGSSGT